MERARKKHFTGAYLSSSGQLYVFICLSFYSTECLVGYIKIIPGLRSPGPIFISWLNPFVSLSRKASRPKPMAVGKIFSISFALPPWTSSAQPPVTAQQRSFMSRVWNSSAFSFSIYHVYLGGDVDHQNHYLSTKISLIPIYPPSFFQNTPPSNTCSLDPRKSRPYFSLLLIPASTSNATSRLWYCSIFDARPAMRVPVDRYLGIIDTRPMARRKR